MLPSKWLCVLAFVVGALSGPTIAQQSSPYLRIVASHQAFLNFTWRDVALKCPAGFVPTQLSISVSHPKVLLVNRYVLIDSQGAPIDYDALTSLDQITGGGYRVSLENSEDEGALENAELRISCLDPAVSADRSLVLARSSLVALPRSTASVLGFCGSDHSVALGGFGSADGVVQIDRGSGPLWGTRTDPQRLEDQSDGTRGPPTGWKTDVENATNGLATINAFHICGNVPAAQTFIRSATWAPNASPAVFGPVPDGWTAVGAGVAGDVPGIGTAVDVWLQDGMVIAEEQFYVSTTDYDSGPAQIRAFALRAPPATAARATLAVLAVPQSDTPVAPTISSAVEFYNATLDHYFMTANSQEINDLDAGVHACWTRTGERFGVYAIGSTGHAERRPVCRLYGVPAAGLNSHFYSASPDECFTVPLNFASAWALESDEVFEVDLPDPSSGACPGGDVPVYRLWNSRADSNHRYTTSIAIRDQMLAKGYVAEGYGPTSVALCVLP